MTETRTTSSTGGEKGVKAQRYGLMPPEPLALVAEHYAKGAEKYDDHNWRKGYEWSKAFDAMQRHAWAYWNGEDIDAETGSPHLAAVVFHAFSLMQWAKDHPEFDDRYSSVPLTAESGDNRKPTNYSLKKWYDSRQLVVGDTYTFTDGRVVRGTGDAWDDLL